MRRGPALVLTALAAATCAALLAAGGALASHGGEGPSCTQPWTCHTNLRPAEARSRDVWVDETNPDHNYDSGSNSEFLFVRAGADQRAWTLLKFPLEDLPRNVSLQRAQLILNPIDLVPGRKLTLWELRTPFVESTVTWNVAKNFDRSLSAVANATVQPPQGPQFPPVVFQNAASEDVLEGVTASMRKYYLGEAPYHGHVVRDDDPTIANLPATQRFLSSASDPSSAQARPMLVLGYDPNVPDIRNLLADGGQAVNASSTRPVNLSLDVFDRKGTVLNAWINATTPEGKEVFNRSVFQNRSTVFLDLFRHRVWSNQSLDLPEGRYILNALALDDDGNLNYTEFRQVNLTVENRPPFVNQSRDANGNPAPFLSASVLDEGATFTAALNASDASGILGVRLAVERGGEVLANLSLAAHRVDGNASGDYRLTAPAVWAGRLNLTLWVEDRAGNLNRTAALPLHVRDVLPPSFTDARVLTPARGADGAIQEEGGSVAWEAIVRDASPLEVTLELAGPTGAERLPLARQGLTDRYRVERTVPLRGAYAAAIVAQDADGNRAERGGLGFFVLEGAPPVVGAQRPSPGGFGGGDGVVSAEVADLNLDPGSLLFEVRVPPAAFTQAETRTLTLSETSRRVEFRDRFFHGERVEVRLRASDILGHATERTWSFTVDDRAPVTFLTTDGPALAGNRTAVTGNTTLRLERSDEGSGLLATVVAVANEDRAVGTGNITITGTQAASMNLSASPVYTGTGNYTLTFGSVDLAGNVEAPQVRRFLVDDTPPRVQASFEPGLLTAEVEERGTGLKEVRARYWLAPGGQQGETLMSPDPARSTWQARVPDAERGTRVLYAIEAVDLLGNAGRAGTAANPLSSIVQNHKPTVSITPANGSLVRGPVAIEWLASDRDGDALQVSVGVRPSTVSQARELAPLRGAQGSITWDTRAVGDGLWLIEVTARDGFETVVVRSQVDVTNTDSKIVSLAADAPRPDQPVRLEAVLYKPVLKAEAVVRLRGQEVARVPLLDDGGPPDRRERDGVFSGQFQPPRTGDYQVDLEVVFADGRLERRDGAATVGVQWAFPARIVHEPLLLVLVVGAPLAAAGYFLFRRYGPPGGLRGRLGR